MMILSSFIILCLHVPSIRSCIPCQRYLLPLLPFSILTHIPHSYTLFSITPPSPNFALNLFYSQRQLGVLELKSFINGHKYHEKDQSQFKGQSLNKPLGTILSHLRPQAIHLRIRFFAELYPYNFVVFSCTSMKQRNDTLEYDM